MSEMMFGGPTAPDPSTGMAPPSDPAGAPQDDPAALVREALDLVRGALQAEPDEQDTLLLEQVTTQLQKYLAANQQLQDKTLGSPDLNRMLRKTG